MLFTPAEDHSALTSVQGRLDALGALRSYRGWEPQEELQYQVLCEAELALLPPHPFRRP